MVTPPRGPLRERSKAKRRLEIQRAALRLFAEYGYEDTTIAEIADEAEVAPRTVSLYFPSKIELAMSPASDAAGRLAATFQLHSDLSYVDVVGRWLSDDNRDQSPEVRALNARLFETNPSLRGIRTAQIDEAARLTSAALAAEIGLPGDDVVVQIVAATVSAAIATFAMSLPAPSKHHEWFLRYLQAVIDAATST